MGSVVRTKISLLRTWSGARVVWPDIKKTLEFKVGLWLLLVFIGGITLLGVVGSFAWTAPPPQVPSVIERVK